MTIVPTRNEAAERYRAAVSDIPEVLALVADVCQAPMAALKVAGDTAAHFAATLGLPFAVDVPQSLSLCRMVSAADDAMVVEDAISDPRVATHPLVARADVRFLAAAPLHAGGHIVGALCVFDTAPRHLDAATTGRFLERIARRIDSETELRHRLEQRSRDVFPALADQDEATSSISHEIRTPLTAIRGHLEMLSETPGAISPEFARSAQAIIRNADRLTRTVDTLLRAADHQRNLPSGDRRPFDLTELAAAVTAGEERFRLSVPETPVHVIADERLLGVALSHVLRNALGYSAADRPVEVSVLGGRHPAIVVRDQGPGLGADEIARLGEPFFRGEVARRDELPGIGLGLTVVRQIVEAQGATLRFDGAPGAGLTVIVEF